MKVRQKSVPAFVLGLISGILGFIGSILSIFSGFGLGLVVPILLLMLPSILIIIGAIVCMFKAKPGGIVMTVGFCLYFIGIIIKNIGFGIVSVIAFPLIAIALTLAFNRVKTVGAENSEADSSTETTTAVTPAPVQHDNPANAPVYGCAPRVNTLSVLGFIFAFLMPIFGLVFGIAGMRDANKYHGGRGRGMGLTAIIISCLIFFVLIFVIVQAIIL